MNDERNGKPSASGVERLSLCPGSWALERTLPPLPETDDAASGTRIHAALAGVANVKLSDEEEDMHDRVAAAIGDALETAIATRSPDLEYWEERIWLGERFSGKADLIVIHKETGCIFDAKTGRNEVATADGNLQLRALACLLQSEHDLDKIIVGIIQPWASERISLAEYTREDLAKSREWLVGVLDAADKPDAPRIPGEKQCRFCRAKAVCPEAQTMAVGQSAAVSKMLGTKEPTAIASAMTPNALGFFLESAAFATSVIDACRDEAKRRLTAGEEVLGWQLKPGAVREVIIDPQTVYERFIEKGGGSATFMPCVEVKKGRLKDQLKAVTGAKGKALDSELADVLQGCTEDKQNAPSLERVK